MHDAAADGLQNAVSLRWINGESAPLVVLGRSRLGTGVAKIKYMKTTILLSMVVAGFAAISNIGNAATGGGGGAAAGGSSGGTAGGMRGNLRAPGLTPPANSTMQSPNANGSQSGLQNPNTINQPNTQNGMNNPGAAPNNPSNPNGAQNGMQNPNTVNQQNMQNGLNNPGAAPNNPNNPSGAQNGLQNPNTVNQPNTQNGMNNTLNAMTNGVQQGVRTLTSPNVNGTPRNNGMNRNPPR